MTLLVLVLLVLAATLGAGGYLAYKRIATLVDTSTKQLGVPAIVVIQNLERIAKSLDTISKTPVGATIHQQNVGLIPVHDMQAVVASKTIAPGAEAMIRLEPVRASWFKGRAIRVLAYVDSMPSIEQRVTIGRCEVNSMPMFQWSGSWTYTKGPTETTSLGLPSDVFAAPPGHGIGIDLAIFSDLANRSPLEFSVRNENPHAVRVCIEIYGEILPAWNKEWNVPGSEESVEG